MPLLLLLQSFSGMTEDVINQIIEYRKDEDIESKYEFITVAGASVYSMLSRFITFENCPFYKVEALGRIEGSPIKQTIRALVEIDKDLEKKFRVVRWKDGQDW